MHALSIIVTLTSLISVTTAFTIREAQDKQCSYGDACWPTSAQWKSFNASISGRLNAVTPAADVCHAVGGNTDPLACVQRSLVWSTGAEVSKFPGAYASHSWGDGYGNDTCFTDTNLLQACGQGRVPPLQVLATSAGDIQKAVQFASKYNLRTRVKSTGHSFTGGASAKGAFGINVHNLKSINFIDNFKLSGSTIKKGSAVTVGAGVQFYELYEAAHKAGVVVVGGGCDSVGVSGWVMGGGHSRYSVALGLGVDNLLEFEIVTPDAKILTVNEKSYPDLWWAVRGGGAGFGVVTKWTFKTHPPIKNELVADFVIEGLTKEQYTAALEGIMLSQPSMRANGWSDLSIGIQATHTIIGVAFKPNASVAKDTASAYKELKEIAAKNAFLFVPVFKTYKSQYETTISETFANQHTLPVDTQTYNSRLLQANFYADAKKVRKAAEFMANNLSLWNFLNVPGGKTAEIKPGGMALNPAWRSALGHLLWTADWKKGATKEEQTTARGAGIALLNEFTDIIGTSDAYINESSPDDEDWPLNYWGTRANYQKLLEIKKQYDPKHLLTCTACVGSEFLGGVPF